LSRQKIRYTSTHLPPKVGSEEIWEKRFELGVTLENRQEILFRPADARS
jgi:hypothetical protein